jgi:hypothetical protein
VHLCQETAKFATPSISCLRGSKRQYQRKINSKAYLMTLVYSIQAECDSFEV